MLCCWVQLLACRLHGTSVGSPAATQGEHKRVIPESTGRHAAAVATTAQRCSHLEGVRELLLLVWLHPPGTCCPSSDSVS
jgi:hypothetical protein